MKARVFEKETSIWVNRLVQLHMLEAKRVEMEIREDEVHRRRVPRITLMAVNTYCREKLQSAS